MAGILRLVRLLILLLAAAITALGTYLFYVANAQAVVIQFLDWRTPELPLWAPLLVAVVFGFLLGMLSLAAVNLRLRWRLRRAERICRGPGRRATGPDEGRELPNPAPG